MGGGARYPACGANANPDVSWEFHPPTSRPRAARRAPGGGADFAAANMNFLFGWRNF